MVGNKLKPYLDSIPDWKIVLKSKFLLVDTDFLISLISYQATGLLDILKELEVTCCYIHPVYIELSNTDNKLQRLQRTTLIDALTQLPFTHIEMKQAVHIQKQLALLNCFPALTDLYLAGTLDRYEKSNMLLATSNLKDFPYPLFKRESGIIIQNERSTKVISLLGLNKV